MYNTFSVLAYAMAGFQTLVMCIAFLFWKRKGGPRRPRMISFLFFLVAIWAFDKCGELYGLFRQHPNLGFIGHTLTFAIPGYTYLFFRVCSEERIRFYWYDIFHATPFLFAAAAAMIGYHFLPLPGKMDFWAGGYRTSLIFDPVVTFVTFGGMNVQLVMLVILGYRYHAGLLSVRSERLAFELRFLKVFALAFTGVIPLLLIRRYMLRQDHSSYLVPPDALVAGWAYLLLTYLLVYLVFSQNKRLKMDENMVVEASAWSTVGSKVATDSVEGTDEHWNYLEDNLAQLMESQKPYLDANLTLVQLAERLEVPARALSRYINKTTGNNFSDYIADWRIDEFKRLCANAQDDFSITSAMHAAGFNSKSTFTGHFRKRMGMTPSQWRVRQGEVI